MGKNHNLWEHLRSSFWFVPSLITAALMALAALLIEAESSELRQELMERWPRLFGAGAEGSRALLSTLAGSMITVAGVTFSITVVALTLAANQYTSRILRNFMRDRANQMVLGVFVGAFGYCLVVLRTIREGEDDQFVPALAVMGALCLALVAIGVLIFFIHHIAGSIQASRIVEAVANETLEGVDLLFPAEAGKPAADEPRKLSPPGGEQNWMAVPSTHSGYIESVDSDLLFEVARKKRLIVRMEKGIGEFIIESFPLVTVNANRVDEETVRQLNKAFSVGRLRTVHQDPGYGIQQIVDVAIKALSPGINDVTTAVICLDYLGAVLSRLAERRMETPLRSDNGRVLVIACGPTFATLVPTALDQIRRYGRDHVAILARLLNLVGEVAERTTVPKRREVLRQQIEHIMETVEQGTLSAHDRSLVQSARDRALQRLAAQAYNAEERAELTPSARK